jgi:hypothetical protein
MNAALQSLVAQWRANRRLRLFVLLALLAVVANLAAASSAGLAERITAYAADHRLLQRLEGAAADDAWTQRAEAASAALLEAEAGITAVAGSGQAQAELQALLAAAAAGAGITDAAIRTEGATDVDGVPGVWEVSARMAGSARGPTATALLGELSKHRWVRVDQIEVRDDGSAQMQMIVRGYFRRAAPENAP